MQQNNIFEDLFVFELANNHIGNIDRGKKIVTEFSKVAKSNNIRAAIKLQFRDVDNFIHKNYKDRKDIKYIEKTIRTKLSPNEYYILSDYIKKSGCLLMSTPFDEKSVKTCLNVGVDIIKIASSDLNDKILIEEIVKTKKPVIISTGGSSVNDIDDIVNSFEKENIPFAINHCVSIYPTADNDLELNQIDYLKKRYPKYVIGYSTHCMNNVLNISTIIAYAKGARTFERHIDIDDGNSISAYCSNPQQTDAWIKAYKNAIILCGENGMARKMPNADEIIYLDEHVRGVYAKKSLKKGDKLTYEDVYLAIPLLKGQISCREFLKSEVLINDVEKDSPVTIDDIDSPYVSDTELKNKIHNRGL